MAILDAATEALIVALPLFAIFGNTMKLSSKLTVVALFAFRLPCIPFVAAATVSLNRFFASDKTGSMDNIISAAVWSQVHLGWSLSSASVPCMKSFLTAFLLTDV